MSIPANCNLLCVRLFDLGDFGSLITMISARLRRPPRLLDLEPRLRRPVALHLDLQLASSHLSLDLRRLRHVESTGMRSEGATWKASVHVESIGTRS